MRHLKIKNLRFEYCYPNSNLYNHWITQCVLNLNQLKNIMSRSKIIKKSVILFQLNNMTIGCKHVHRLELQKFLQLV